MTPLVLLHGWGMSPRVFDVLRAKLSGRYEVHAPALPGYSGAVPCTPYALGTIAREVRGAAPGRCHVAGWSLGGQVALEWARAAPAQVERLVLIAATPSFVRRCGWDAAVDAAVLQDFAGAVAVDRNAALKRFVSLQARGDVAARRVALALRPYIADEALTTVETLQGGLDVLLRTDLRATLETTAHDTLVVHGERDALVPPAAAEHLARTLPRCRRSLISGAAHAPFVSDPDGVARAILEFLDE